VKEEVPEPASGDVGGELERCWKCRMRLASTAVEGCGRGTGLVQEPTDGGEKMLTMYGQRWRLL